MERRGDSSYLFRKGTWRGGGGEKAEISLPRQAGEQARVGGILRERSLSLKGIGYPGDRKGQQN